MNLFSIARDIFEAGPEEGEPTIFKDVRDVFIYDI